MDEKWILQLINNGHAIVQKYVWVIVNISRVQALVRVFILGDDQVYDLFLSKK